MPAQAGVYYRAHVGYRGVVPGVGQVDGALLHPARVGNENQQQLLRGERDQLDVPDRGPGQRRVLHHGHLAGQLDQQPHRAHHHVVEVVRTRQERLDGAPLGRRQRLDAGQPVDEEPVALVRRYPPGAGVRLRDETLLLEHRHVVPDGRGRYVEVMPVDERLGSHRFSGGHVVFDDRTEHRQFPVVEHAFTSLALTWHS